MRKNILVAFVILMTLFLSVGCGNQGTIDRTISINRAELTSTGITDDVWKDKIQANAEYVSSLDPYRMLYFYYKTAGLEVPNDAKPYGGCELTNDPYWHGGMMMGHVLSANAMLYSSLNEQKYKDTVSLYVSELKKCQADNGYLFSRTEDCFDNLERGEGDWGVIYYYMHKVFAGLIDAYTYCNNEEALEIAEKLSDWLYSRMSALSKNDIQRVLVTEYGGMNECLYNLYAITGNPRDKFNAECFNESLYLDAWAQNVDNITMIHGNTAIPKAVGFARGYMVTKEQKLLDAAQNFWSMVAEKRIFATGGICEREFFGEANVTSNQLYDTPSEICKSYNMLKLSQYLYEITADPKYVDYIERVLLNSLMGSIDEDGCKTYYQFLGGADCKKLFHDEYNTFWCCTGTGMETFAKIAESCYHTENPTTVEVNVFISSTYKNDNIEFELLSDEGRNEIEIKSDTSSYYCIKLRAPYWAKSIKVSVDGKEESAQVDDRGYVVLNKIWKRGQKIVYETEYGAYRESTYDNEDVFAIKYGPYLMAAEGRRYEAGNRLAGSFSDGWLSDLNSSIVKGEGGLVLKTADFDVPLRKYGEITNDFYTVYFERIDAFSENDLKPNLAMRAEISSSLGYPFYPDNTQIERTFYDMHVSGIAKYLFAIVDGETGNDSRGKYGSDKTMNRAFLLYAPSLNFPAGQHWIDFDFGEEQSISSLKVAFAYGEGLATRYPTNFVVQYYSDEQWVNVSNQVNPVFGSGFNNVTFDTVKTSRMRIFMKNSFSVSVLEVKI